MTRALYATLLRLHPPAFRRQFAAEMLWIFDEARVTEGACALLVDLLISFARQWLLRSGLWKIAAALIGAALQVGPPFWMTTRRRFLPTQFRPEAQIPTDWFVATTLCLIAFVACMVVVSVFWATRVSRPARHRGR